MSSGGGSSDPKWQSVPGDSRYEEKFIQKSDGSITRITREAGQTREYPHHTEFYTPGGGYEIHKSDDKSTHDSKVHRTGDSILKDLGLDD